MKSFILSTCIVAAFVGLSSCEKHDWDKTKKLYETHDDKGHDDHSGHSHEGDDQKKDEH